MNRLRECSGLARMRQELEWVVSVLAGLVILLGVGEVAEADDRVRCGTGTTWIGCSSNPSFDCGAQQADPQDKYLYCAYGLDAYCNLYIANCWYASTPCSESEQEVAPAVSDAAMCFESIDMKIECSYFDDCAELNSTEPYRHCTTYYGADGDIYWTHCDCSSTPCSESEQDQMTAVLTSVIAGRPAQHRLSDSYPNPFNPEVVIPLDLATDEERVDLALYDVLGRRVRQVWDGPLRVGSHRFTWDGCDEAGKGVAAGVYIYKVEVDGWVEAKKTTKLP